MTNKYSSQYSEIDPKITSHLVNEPKIYTPEVERPQDHVLVEAEKIIHGQRREDYGGAKESFQRISDLWAPILASDLPEVDKVALCMIQLKVARYCVSQTRDSVVDIAGYAGCLGQINGWED